jgi:hypothetical protein
MTELVNDIFGKADVVEEEEDPGVGGGIPYREDDPEQMEDEGPQ